MEEFIKDNFNTLTKQEMADILGISYNQVDWICRINNLKHYKSVKYTDEEIEFIINNYPIYGSKYCAKVLNRSENAINKKIKKMNLQINWKYHYINANGYLVNCEDRNNRYLVHRKVMEDHLGRKLKNTEIVHHKDMNKLNNDISNLQIVTRSEHAKIHKDYLKKCQYKI